MANYISQFEGEEIDKGVKGGINYLDSKGYLFNLIGVSTSLESAVETLNNSPTLMSHQKIQGVGLIFKDLNSNIIEAVFDDVDSNNFSSPSKWRSHYILTDIEYPLLDGSLSKFVRADGTLSEIAIGSGGYAANVYPTNVNSDVATYKKLSYTSDVSAIEISGTSSNNVPTLIANYLYDQSIGVTTIDAGIWRFTTMARVDQAQGVTKLRITVFKRATNGTETNLFSFDSEEINNTSNEKKVIEYNAPLFTVVDTDRIGIRLYAVSDATSNRTITLTIGDGNAAYLNTPVALRHKQLREPNEDPNVQHMTAEEASHVEALTNGAYQAVSEKNAANGYPGLDASGKLTEGLLPFHYQKSSEKGQPNGYASLDGGGDVPDAQIPTNIERNTNKNAANGYVGLDSEIKIDNRQLRRTNGYYSPGISDLIKIDHDDRLNFGTDDFTIECSFTYHSGAGAIVRKNGADSHFIIYINGSYELQVYLTGSGINKVLTVSGMTISKEVDYHCVVSRINNRVFVYLNSQVVGIFDILSMNLTSGVPIYIGQVGLNFSIHNLRIFNRGFGQLDVDRYYNNGQPDKTRLTYSDTNIVTAELFSGGDFESGLKGSKGDSSGTVSTWSLNTVTPISGSQDGRLEVTTGSTSDPFVPYLSFPMSLKSGLKYKVSFKYKLNAGIIDNKIRVWNGYSRLLLETLNDYIKTSETISFTLDMVYDYSLLLYFETINNNLIDIQIDDISVKQIGSVLELLPENATPTTWLGTQQGINGITSGNPSLNYGNFYKKEEITAEPSFIEFERTGNGSKIARVNVLCSTSNVAIITGGEFFSDDGTTPTSLGTSVQLFAGLDRPLYYKATNKFGTIKVLNLNKLFNISAPAHAPILRGSLTDSSIRSYADFSNTAGNIKGDCKDLNRHMKYFSTGVSSLSGDIINAPRGLIGFTIGVNCPNVTGLFRDLPRLLVQCYIYSGTVGGNIDDLPNMLNDIKIQKGSGGGTPFSYTAGHVFAQSINQLIIRPYTVGELTSTDIDNIFIDLNNSVTTAIGAKTIDLRGNCAAPTAASLDARNELASKGFTLYIN